jgi:hypothetical protein
MKINGRDQKGFQIYKVRGKRQYLIVYGPYVSGQGGGWPAVAVLLADIVTENLKAYKLRLKVNAGSGIWCSCYISDRYLRHNHVTVTWKNTPDIWKREFEGQFPELLSNQEEVVV